jgi:hypothetical protein
MEQSFENHARYVPLYHFVALGILFLNVVWTGYLAITAPSIATLVGLLLALALTIVAVYARTFALTVQDRLISLEMRLRLRELLPQDLRGRIDELTVAQLVALRFAGDDELSGLTRKVLDQGLTDKTTIKRMIRQWRPDHLRV